MSPRAESYVLRDEELDPGDSDLVASTRHEHRLFACAIMCGSAVVCRSVQLVLKPDRELLYSRHCRHLPQTLAGPRPAAVPGQSAVLGGVSSYLGVQDGQLAGGRGVGSGTVTVDVSPCSSPRHQYTGESHPLHCAPAAHAFICISERRSRLCDEPLHPPGCLTNPVTFPP